MAALPCVAALHCAPRVENDNRGGASGPFISFACLLACSPSCSSTSISSSCYPPCCKRRPLGFSQCPAQRIIDIMMALMMRAL